MSIFKDLNFILSAIDFKPKPRQVTNYDGILQYVVDEEGNLMPEMMVPESAKIYVKLAKQRSTFVKNILNRLFKTENKDRLYFPFMEFSDKIELSRNKGTKDVMSDYSCYKAINLILETIEDMEHHFGFNIKNGFEKRNGNIILTVEDYIEGFYYLKNDKRSYKIGPIITKIKDNIDEKPYSFIKSIINAANINATMDDIIKQFNLRPSKKLLKLNKLMVCITRRPVDVAAMSSGQRWSSCMTLPGYHPERTEGGIYHDRVKGDIVAGTIVAYLIEDSEKGKGLRDPKPYARLAAKPFVLYDENKNIIDMILVNENSLYHDNSLDKNIYEKFNDFFNKWLDKNQEDKIKSGEYVRLMSIDLKDKLPYKFTEQKLYRDSDVDDLIKVKFTLPNNIYEAQQFIEEEPLRLLNDNFQNDKYVNNFLTTFLPTESLKYIIDLICKIFIYSRSKKLNKIFINALSNKIKINKDIQYLLLYKNLPKYFNFSALSYSLLDHNKDFIKNFINSDLDDETLLMLLQSSNLSELEYKNYLLIYIKENKNVDFYKKLFKIPLKNIKENGYIHTNIKNTIQSMLYDIINDLEFNEILNILNTYKDALDPLHEELVIKITNKIQNLNDFEKFLFSNTISNDSIQNNIKNIDDNINDDNNILLKYTKEFIKKDNNIKEIINYLENLQKYYDLLFIKVINYITKDDNNLKSFIDNKLIRYNNIFNDIDSSFVIDYNKIYELKRNILNYYINNNTYDKNHIIFLNFMHNFINTSGCEMIIKNWINHMTKIEDMKLLLFNIRFDAVKYILYFDEQNIEYTFDDFIKLIMYDTSCTNYIYVVFIKNILHTKFNDKLIEFLNIYMKNEINDNVIKSILDEKEAEEIVNLLKIKDTKLSNKIIHYLNTYINENFNYSYIKLFVKGLLSEIPLINIKNIFNNNRNKFVDFLYDYTLSEKEFQFCMTNDILKENDLLHHVIHTNKNYIINNPKYIIYYINALDPIQILYKRDYDINKEVYFINDLYDSIRRDKNDNKSLNEKLKNAILETNYIKEFNNNILKEFKNIIDKHEKDKFLPFKRTVTQLRVLIPHYEFILDKLDEEFKEFINDRE